MKNLLIGFFPDPDRTDYPYNVNDDYQLVRSAADDVKIFNPNSSKEDNLIIKSKIIEIAWTDRYIVSKREGLKRRSDNSDSNQATNEKVFDYWIFDTENSKVYGPLDDEAFEEQKEELGIPADLKLKDINLYMDK